MQAIPNWPDAGYGVNVPNLAYSIAFSTPSCLFPAYGGSRCGENNYEYKLYRCENPCNQNSIDLNAVHNGVCVQQPPQDLDFCTNARYFCFITAFFGGNNQPTENAFIEWYWVCTGLASTRPEISGKFTWVATSEWLLNAWNKNGRNYVNGFGSYPFGLPLFNTANHTPQ
jgi:hypothetical protein